MTATVIDLGQYRDRLNAGHDLSNEDGTRLLNEVEELRTRSATLLQEATRLKNDLEVGARNMQTLAGQMLDEAIRPLDDGLVRYRKGGGK